MTERGSEGNVGAPTNEVMVEVFEVPCWTSISVFGSQGRDHTCWLVGADVSSAVRADGVTSEARQVASLREQGSRWGNFVVGLSAKAAARLPHSTVRWR